MAFSELQKLGNNYPSQDKEALVSLNGNYQRRYQREILELAAIAADGVQNAWDLGLEPDLDPQVWEAFQLQYPHETIDSLRDSIATSANPEGTIDGWERGIRGKYFEVLVRDELRAGENVGDIKLGPGEDAILAESPTEKGWDLSIVDEDGNSIREVSLKVVKDFDDVEDALERYSQYEVMTTSDHESEAIANEMVSTTDHQREDLIEMVMGQIDEATEGVADDIAEQALEVAFDAIPFASLLIIPSTEIWKMRRNGHSVKEALRRSKRRLGRAGVYSAIEATVNSTPAAPVSVPITMALRLTQTRIGQRVALDNYLEEKTHEILREIEQGRLLTRPA